MCGQHGKTRLAAVLAFGLSLMTVTAVSVAADVAVTGKRTMRGGSIYQGDDNIDIPFRYSDSLESKGTSSVSFRLICPVPGQEGVDGFRIEPDSTGLGWTFGTTALTMRFDGLSGMPRECKINGETVLVDDERFASSFVVNPTADTEPWKTPNPPLFYLSRIVRRDMRTISVESTNADWRVVTNYRLYPEQGMIRRWFDFEWLGTSPGKIKRLWVSSGKMPCVGGKGGYRRPMFFPPRLVVSSNFSDGVAERGHEDVSPIVGENGTGWAVAVVHDGHQAYSDRAWSYVTQRSDGFSLSVVYESYGHVRKGETQTVGDAWHVFRRGGIDDVIEALPEWYAMTGQKVLPDREERVKKLILYSTHPKGTSAEWLSDARGFGAMTNNLKLIDALGANAIWLRPVEDYTCYVPRDYYKLMAGVGTPDDFKAFVSAAHARHIEVWRDGVMHGGYSDNERTKAHPEWLAYREDGTYRDFWGYDFNWPTWVDYFAEYIRFMTREYVLDGWRLDVPIGSLNPNWSEQIPYARASYAQYQGAWSQQRAIRKAMRESNSQALSLAESNLSQHGNTSDAIYDQRIAHDNLPEALTSGMSPADFVKAMRRWLYEQERVFLPDVVLLRYPESHDSVRSADAYGRAPTDALMAMCAWIKGFPLVYNEGEDGCFETWRRIFALRRAVPELNTGTADYLGVQAPDGVLSWMRSGDKGKSVAIVNFNPTNVSGRVIWPGGSVPIALTAYAYRLVRVEGASVAELLPTSVHKPFVCIREEDGESFGVPQFDLRDLSNRLLGGEECLSVNRSEQGWSVRVTDTKGMNPKDIQLVVRFPGAERWFARSSDGVWNSPHFVWHPSYDAVNSSSYHTLRHGALRWRNLYHPFGLNGVQAEVGAIAGERALSVGQFSNTANIYIWDRLGSDPTLAVGISGDAIQDLKCEVLSGSARDHLRNTGPDTGDSRLKVMIGGYEFEERGFRVRIDRKGMLRDVWTESCGTWIKQPLPCYLDAKLLNTSARKEAKVDCCHRFSKLADGCLKIDFYDGYYKDTSSTNRSYRIEYVLGGERQMTISHDF